MLSSIHVENVVYAPRNPIITGGRRSAGRTDRSITSANRAPSANEPETLITRVPQGNAPEPAEETHPSTR
jgi:hypothetical protein